ncbi:hypothetical protein [Clostridium beijerinckii]|nr:hypothetical protein [Clostridium beijerinckii]NRX53063.1 hypothetical protein [Clostridium beijerinckii]NSA36183.1 hypothetical protein [Clostridium beijerinckii]NSA37514.1 hypothetical protein [Clostridium beijerinckii]
MLEIFLINVVFIHSKEYTLTRILLDGEQEKYFSLSILFRVNL